jgi:tubulin-specific chaperone B
LDLSLSRTSTSCHELTNITTFNLGITTSSRIQLLPSTSDARRGTIRYIGPVPEIPGGGGPWIGIELDEPTGKNDGSVAGKRYFQCGEKCGVFVRPERVEVGEFPVLDELGMDEDMEEL